MTTPAQQLANYVQTTLASGCTSGATTISVVSASGLPTSGNFMLRIDDVAPATTFEYVECTGVSGTTLTVTRGQEGTTGIAHSAGAIVGNDITAAMLQRAFPLGLFPGGHVSVAANQGSITAQTDVTGLTVTITPLNASRKIRIRAFITLSSTVATDSGAGFLMEGATQLASTPQGAYTNATTGYGMFIEAILNPSFASHTYKVQAARTLGTGTFTMSASSTAPAWLTVEDIGPA